MKALQFSLGQLVMTPGAEQTFDMDTRVKCLKRHASRDWGDIDPEDATNNDLGVERNGRILSAYNIGEHQLWIITEADRSVTTLLLPSEY